MASPESSKLVEAVSAAHAALEPLDPEDRSRVIYSVMTLLGMSSPTPPQAASGAGAKALTPDPVLLSKAARPLSLVELMQNKQPASNVQRIAVFAFYREKVEGFPRFSRADLKDYFARAKLTPSGNFDRDFTAVVRLGWVHEDGEDSYLTTKGLEAVEAGFAGKQLPRGRATKKKTRKKTRKKKTRKKTRKKKTTRRKRG